MQAMLATLGYVLSPERDRVLMIRRDRRPDDFHFGKFNGLGGKLEPDEDVCTGIRREIREEAGIECGELEFAGTISWPGFGRHGEGWFGVIFRVPRWTGTPLASNHEGTLVWVDTADLLAGRVPVWDSDLHFLPLVLAVRPRPFHGVMPWADGRALSWSYTEL